MSTKIAVCACIFSCLAISSFGSAAAPIQLSVDLTDAPRKLLHARLTIPVEPGPVTLVYPQWIPGEHGPTGPVGDLAGLVFTADGRTLGWRRDDVNMYAIHVDVPTGARMLDVKLDFLATAPPTGFSAGASTGANLAVLSWNELLLYPSGATAASVIFEPTVTLPAGWHFGTALTRASSNGDASGRTSSGAGATRNSRSRKYRLCSGFHL